jgi:hypothetical protein
MSLTAHEDIVHDEWWFRSRIGPGLRATVEIEQKHLWRQIELLWDHNRERREEIIAAQKRLTKEIEAIKSRINGAIWSFACAAAGAVVILLKPKPGL